MNLEKDSTQHKTSYLRKLSSLGVNKIYRNSKNKLHANIDWNVTNRNSESIVILITIRVSIFEDFKSVRNLMAARLAR